MRFPSFPLYPDDLVAGTIAMTAAEVGQYVRLLCYQWGNGKIPSAKTALFRIAGGKVSYTVLRKFPQGKNPRLERERQKLLDFREKQRQCGLASAKARLNHRSTTVQPPLEGGSNEPPTSTPTKGQLPSPLPLPLPSTKNPTKLPASFTEWQTETTAGYDRALGPEWENDRQKWMTRIKRNVGKSWRVLAELENAQREKRILTTPARYAEQIWKEFK